MKSRNPPSYFAARIVKGAPVDLQHTDVGKRFRDEQKRLAEIKRNEAESLAKVTQLKARKK